jgi:glutamate 5-kinase
LAGLDFPPSLPLSPYFGFLFLLFMKLRSKRWVVKLGSNLLTRENGVNQEHIKSIADLVAALTRKGFEVILVSSGAISAGMSALNLNKRPVERFALQGCATIGQPRLMKAYDEAFAHHGMITGQILLTSWDLDSRAIYAITRQTLEHLLGLKHCVPIFNENDALSFEELAMLNKFGDNDRLSAHIAILAEAAQLVILSTVDGLRTKPDGTGTLVKKVEAIDARIKGYAGKSQNDRSVGGMVSKLQTAQYMLDHGIPMVIADGRAPEVLLKIAGGKEIGTRFEAGKKVKR